jgi:hypothetical protein
VIAGRFASGDFAVGLRIGETRLDLVQDRLLGKTRILQVRDLRSAEGPMPLKAALQNKLHEAVRQADKAKRDGIAADGIELISAGNLQNLLLRISRAGEICGGVAAGERMLSFVRSGNKSYASIVAQPSLLDFHELGDLGIRRIQLFEFLEAAGPHARLVKRSIIRQRMLVATDRKEDRDAGKQSAKLHLSILAGSKGNGLACAVGGTCAEGQVECRKRGTSRVKAALKKRVKSQIW